MSTIRADNYSKRDGSSTISADTLLQGTAKVWGNINGTGVISLTDGFNVSSIIDNGIGDYTFSFSTAMPNANYKIGVSGYTTNIFLHVFIGVSLLVSSARPGVIGNWDGNAAASASVVDGRQMISIHGDPA